MLRSVLALSLLVGGADAFVARPGPVSISRTRSSTAGAVSMGLFNREPEDPWEAMRARGEKELRGGQNSARDDPYDKRNVGVGMRAAKFRTIDKVPQQQYTADGRPINKRGPNPNARAFSKRQVRPSAVATPQARGSRPGVSVAAGMGASKVRTACVEVRI